MKINLPTVKKRFRIKEIATISTLSILLLTGCTNTDVTTKLDDVNLKECLSPNLEIYKQIPSVNNGSVINDMKLVLSKDNKEISCYLKKLGISKHTDKKLALQRIHDFITIKQTYISDEKYKFSNGKSDDGVKYLSRYIADNGGDCEDKAMFALALMLKIGIDPYIIDVDNINGGIGHVALGLTDEFLLKDNSFKKYILSIAETDEKIITFDPADGERTSKQIGQGLIQAKYAGNNDKYEFKFMRASEFLINE